MFPNGHSPRYVLLPRKSVDAQGFDKFAPLGPCIVSSAVSNTDVALAQEGAEC